MSYFRRNVILRIENLELKNKFTSFFLLANINFLVADGDRFAHPLHHLGKAQSDLPLIAIDSFRHMYLFPNFKDMYTPGKLKQFLNDLYSGKLHRYALNFFVFSKYLAINILGNSIMVLMRKRRMKRLTSNRSIVIKEGRNHLNQHLRSWVHQNSDTQY